MKLTEIVAGKAVTALIVIAGVGGAFWYLKNKISAPLNDAKTATNKEFKESGLGSLFSFSDSIFSGMRATGNDSETSGGIVASTGTKAGKEGIEFNWVDALNPLSSLITSGGFIYNNYIKDVVKPTPQEGNQTTSGVPLLISKPIVFPKESQEIVDKTLADSWFTYTGKN